MRAGVVADTGQKDQEDAEISLWGLIAWLKSHEAKVVSIMCEHFARTRESCSRGDDTELQVEGVADPWLLPAPVSPPWFVIHGRDKRIAFEFCPQLA